MRTAMSDLMDKNRVGSASTAVGARSDGSIIKNNDETMSMFNISANGPKRTKRSKNRNP